MRKINSNSIVDKVKELCIKANYQLPSDIKNALDRSCKDETSSLAQYVLESLKKNAEIAEQEDIPLCQDTGICVFFIDIGQELVIEGDIYLAINEGVRQGYKEGYLRKSVVNNPLWRENTQDNTPSIVHVTLTPGDKLKVQLMIKGAGSENMSAVKMLPLCEGTEGVKKFAIETVKTAGANACPPLIVGIGIGGDIETCALLAKKSLLRPLGKNNADPKIAAIENELFLEINELGIGPAGFGGKTTVLAVHAEVYPCHIASLPVAVNINCHAHRHAEVVI
ncbi:MAG: fumarate hydratase [bacterium]